MANKKLRVDLDIETANAKRQLGELGGSVGSGAPIGKAEEKLERATAANTKQMMQMTRAFTGMALGLAASYSSNYFKQGSTAEKALGYAGSIFSGGSSGAMLGMTMGPQGAIAGAVVGGIVGGLKEFFDRDGAKTKATEDFELSESRYEESLAFSGFLKRLTSQFNTDSIDVKIAELGDYYDTLCGVIDDTITDIKDAIKDGDLDTAKDLREELQIWRSRKAQVMNVAEQLDNNARGPAVASRNPLDALMKIGGGFGLPVSGDSSRVESILGTKFDEHGLAITRLLEDIRANTKKGGATWQ